MADRLVIVRGIALPERDAVLMSDDVGATWRAVDLPGATEAVELSEPVDLNDVAAVAAPGMSWTTADGLTWRQGPAFGDTLGLRPFLGRVDDLLVASALGDGRFQVFTSRDRGETWESAAVQGVEPAAGSYAQMSSVFEDDGRLVGYLNGDFGQGDRPVLLSEDGGRSWTARPTDEVCPCSGGLPQREDGAISLDGGRTWVVPELPDNVLGELNSVIDTGRHWVGAAEYFEAGAGLSETLLSSTDGRRWVHAAPRGCRQGRFSAPVRFHNRWYIGSECASTEDGVLLVSADGGATFTALEGTRRSGRLATPLIIQERLVVPVKDHEVFTGLVEIEPR